MSQKSTAFEKLIAQIHHILEIRYDSEVIWNESIPDPDNPGQLRQIDISIKKGSTITHIECRIHNEKQDVKWIEELIGRKKSLNVDFIIGVSDNGFTKGAVLKAKKFGIILKDLRHLTEQEITSWGNTAILSAEYLVFDKANFVLNLNDNSKNKKIKHKEVINFFKKSFSIVDQSIDHFRKNPIESGITYNLSYNCPITSDISFQGIKVISFDAQYDEVQIISKEYVISESLFYGSPEEEVDQRDTNIQENKEIGWRLINTPIKGRITIDLSTFNHPENSFFLRLKFSNLDKDKLYDIGVKNPKLLDQKEYKKITFGYKFVKSTQIIKPEKRVFDFNEIEENSFNYINQGNNLVTLGKKNANNAELFKQAAEKYSTAIEFMDSILKIIKVRPRVDYIKARREYYLGRVDSLSHHLEIRNNHYSKAVKLLISAEIHISQAIKLLTASHYLFNEKDKKAILEERSSWMCQLLSTERDRLNILCEILESQGNLEEYLNHRLTGEKNQLLLYAKVKNSNLSDYDKRLEEAYCYVSKSNTANARVGLLLKKNDNLKYYSEIMFEYDESIKHLEKASEICPEFEQIVFGLQKMQAIKRSFHDFT